MSIEVFEARDFPELDIESDMRVSEVPMEEPPRKKALSTQPSKIGALMRVSVIIPFSRADTVGNAIESVMAQQYPDDQLEIIVVGMGSNAIQDNWPSVVAIDEGPILQPGKARNLGASKATGDILLFLDDDCEAQMGWIDQNLAELENEEVGAVGGMIKGKSTAYFARCVDMANFGSAQKGRGGDGRLWTATFGVRRDLFETLGGFNEQIEVQEDIDFCFRLWRRGYRTLYQPRIKVLHNHGRGSLGALLKYQYRNGLKGGLEVESTYPDVGLRNKLLAKLSNPLLYLFAVVPLTVAGTLWAVVENLWDAPRSLLLSPFVLIAKFCGHLGILQRLIREAFAGSWKKNGFFHSVVNVFEYGFLKSRFKTPRVLTLYVTSACNAKCIHCFYWKNLNQKSDLSFEEITQLSRSMGRIDKLLIAGGEPFMRRELPEICQLFFKNNMARTVSIPTNGLTPKHIHRQLRRILIAATGRTVRLNLSLDGTECMHDEIRGVPGNFQKVIETYKLARTLQQEYSNLSIGLSSCVMDKNYEDLFDLYDEMPHLFPDIDLPGLILLRGNPLEKTLELPDVEDLRRLHRHKSAKIGHRQPILHRLADAANFNIGLKTIRAETQVIPCEAGRILGVVEDNGDVRHCELLPPIGNLREKSFPDIWSSPESKAARKKIVDKQCRCTHECNVYESLLAHPLQGMKALARKD